MCEYLLESWDILSEKLVELMPWNVVPAFPLTVFAVVLFFRQQLMLREFL
jgi:hypothetical protein